MESMSSQERALQYFKRLLKASSPKAELERILSDINNLVFSSSQKPIDAANKVKILEELEKLIKRSRQSSFKNLTESGNFRAFQKRAEASDNSDILDVISAMKKRVG